MRIRSSAVVATDGRVTLVSGPPLTLRQVHHTPGADVTLCLVGSAAGPLAGDDLTLSLDVGAGMRVRLVATGASIAQGRGGPPARVTMTASVAEGATLVADPGALVVAQGGRVEVAVTIAVGPDATLEWREVVALGRSRDTGRGDATIRWDVERDGRPVLRQVVRSADVRHRVLATVLRTSPSLDARTVVASPTAVGQRIDGRTDLLTVLGDDAASVDEQLASLLRPACAPAVAAPAR
ncbi:urease accessory protein UreD [Jatrophihabitans fulvus]